MSSSRSSVVTNEGAAAAAGTGGGSGSNAPPPPPPTATVTASTNGGGGVSAPSSFNIAGVGPTRRPLALNGISSTIEDKNLDFLCPICFDLIVEAYITRCGHTFCNQCILKSIETFKRCPKCNSTLTSSADHIFPNYLLGELISKYRLRQLAMDKIAASARHCDRMDFNSSGGGGGSAAAKKSTDDCDGLKQFITSESEKLALPDVNVILEILQQRKWLLESESSIAQNRLLAEFLKHLLRQKEQQAAQIAREIDLVQRDMHEVQTILNETTGGGGGADDGSSSSSSSSTTVMTKEIVQLLDKMENAGGGVGRLLTGDAGFNSFRDQQPAINLMARKRRMHAHFDDFVKSYFSVRRQELYIGGGGSGADDTAKADTDGGGVDVKMADDCAGGGGSASTPATTTINDTVRRQGLDVFRENLVKFSKFNTLRPLATMHYSSDLHNNSTIVSTIVFDKDNEYFAIGGVTKRIKIFDYLAVIRDTVDIHYPSVEMISNSKISCIAWNSYHKNILASSDYEGAVNIWDVQTGQRTKSFHEHEKRCWSVDFNDVDTRLIASGSDDARVKLWSTNDERSIATLEAKANVCCVKFNPRSSCHLAFGSADHDVHYYDLRNLSKALCVFKGHKKAVSYVKFLNTDEIISASTDSQLKLWNVNQPPYSLRSFVGHVNEKNFVGLATDGDYVACGSEDNALYIYYKGLSKQLFNFRVDANPSGGGGGGGSCGPKVSETERLNDTTEFVSAVCWRKGCDVVLAANSRGLIRVLELV